MLAFQASEREGSARHLRIVLSIAVISREYPSACDAKGRPMTAAYQDAGGNSAASRSKFADACMSRGLIVS